MNEGSYSQAGFHYQNYLAALKILELLDAGSDIDFIELEKFSKGAHIDDIIVTRKNRVDFYQVKWSNDESKSFTLYNVVFEATEDDKGDKKKTLWQKLVRGYETSITDGKPATITLYSTRPAGNSKMASKGIDKSLAELISFQIAFSQSEGKRIDEIPNYQEFKPLLDKISDEVGPGMKTFAIFFKCLRFELKMPNLDALKLKLNYKLNDLGLEESLADRLLVQVVDWSIFANKITSKTLKDALGISSRFEDKISHTFKINETLYVENSGLIEELNKALNVNDGGFILVEGVPGAGKSTALTKYFEKNDDIHFSYYCFLPDDALTSTLRMKSDYFLKSLCILIENAFQSDSLPGRYSGNFEEKFVSYVEYLSKLDKRIIFLVDGLDHVHRSLSTNANPLTNALPLILPENVFFVISSQYDAALPESIRAEIVANPERLIKISRFNEGQIKQYTLKKGLELTIEQLTLLHRRSEGIPLYLHYITAGFKDTEPVDYYAVINSYPELVNGNIITYHTRLFQQIDADNNALWILSLLAYRRWFTSIEVISQILAGANKKMDVVEIRDVIIRFKHLLKERDGSYYGIFHNSFREYLQERTVAMRKTIAEALGGFYESDPFQHEAYANYFNHLLQAEKYHKILSIVNDEWITTSWERYKSPDDILENLHLAWKAAVELSDLPEFIRVAYLILQVGTMKPNLENNGVDTTILLLNVGLPKESLSTIWDGEYPRIQQTSYFNRYALRYKEATGAVIPELTANAFFSRFLNELKDSDDERNATDYSGYFMAKSLYAKAADWIKELKIYRNKITDDDLKEILNYLADHNKLGHLMHFYESESVSMFKCLSYSLIGSCLAQNGADDYKQYLNQVVFSEISAVDIVVCILRLITSGKWDDTVEIMATQEIVPYIDNEIMTSPDHLIDSRVLQVFDQMKVLYFLDEANYNQLEISINWLDNYPRNIYKAYSTAARIWGRWQRNKTVAPNIIELKTVIDLMIIPRYSGDQIKGLLDARHFIIYHIHQLYEPIFRLLAEICDDDTLKLLIDHWLQVHETAGVRTHESDIAFALRLIDRPLLKESVGLLIKDAEYLARLDENTSPMVSNLNRVANAYGALHFKDEFNRVYGDMLPLSCGVNYRKDYQFSNIIPLLREMHKIEPGGTLHRFADIYELAHKIKDAGNQSMKNSSFAVLINFILPHFPQLGFTVLVNEEPNLHRDGALDDIILALIPNSEDEHLPYLWALIKTMGKWENFDRDEDSYTHQVFISFFERLAAFKNEIFIRSCYNDVFYHFNVEQAMPIRIETINDILNSSGRTFDFLQHPTPPTKKILPQREWQEAKESITRFMLKQVKLTQEQILMMIKVDIESVYKYVDDYVLFSNINKITPVWHDLYLDFSGFLEDWTSALNADDALKVKLALRIIQRFFLNQKIAIARKIEKGVKAYTDSLRDTFDLMTKLFEGTGFNEYFKGPLAFSSISKRLYLKSHNHKSKIYQAILNEELLWLVEQSSFDVAEKMEALAIRYFNNEFIAKTLLALSKRVKIWDEELAKKFAEKTFDYIENNFSAERKTSADLLNWYYQFDPENAKYRSLQIFQNSHYGYTYQIQTDLWDYVQSWGYRFENTNTFPAYFQANFAYNKKLTEGLQGEMVDSEFIRNHEENADFGTVVTNYLIELFNYPVVKIRELTLTALYDLFPINSNAVAAFANINLRSSEANVIEHFIVLLHALHFKYPGQVVAIMNNCKWILEIRHFNILETARQLIFALNDTEEGLDKELVDRAGIINCRPLVPDPEIIRLSLPSPMRAFGPQQGVLIDKLNDHQSGPESFSKLLHQTVIDLGYNYGTAKATETIFYEHYNINNNYDSLEINGTIHRQIHEQINSLFVKLIQRGRFEDEDIEEIKYDFRLYDPTDLFNKRVARPDYIKWKLPNISSEEFLEFNDINQLTSSLMNRQDDMVTVFETGNDWLDGYPDHFNTEFTLCLFLADKDQSESQLVKLLDGYTPYYHRSNLYRSEISDYFETKDYPVKMRGKLTALVCSAPKRFRYKWLDSLAIPLPKLAKHWGLIKNGNLKWDLSDGTNASNLIEWQGPFKDMSTRRFEPLSFGTTLNIKRELLKDFVDTENKNLCMYLKISRTGDKYKRTHLMSWKERIFVKIVQL